MKISYTSICVLVSVILSASVAFSTEQNNSRIRAGQDFFYANKKKFVIKGMNYEPTYPGEVPWNLRNTTPFKARVAKEIKTIKSLGVNTIRVWDYPEAVYQYAKEQGVYVLQVIWIDGFASDYQDKAFKKKQKRFIKDMVDKLHQKRNRFSDIILAYCVGNELSKESILKTDTLHPEITSFSGKFVSTPKQATPTACFIAEMADFLKQYEFETYGETHLVTYSNHVVTEDMLDCSFLDFLSFNGYCNSVPEFFKGAKGSHTGTVFQGWLEYLKKKYPNKPLLVSEFGLSTAPGLSRKTGPDYGYGGNTQEDQSSAIAQMWKDIQSADPSVAGGIIFEYHDVWWRGSKPEEDKKSHDPKDAEEWFGIVQIDGNSETNYKTKSKSVFLKIKQLFHERQIR